MNNMMEQKALNLLGMATRARMLVTGEEQVITAIQNNKIDLVICSTECSENTSKKLKNKCEHYKVPFAQVFDTFQISQAIGKHRSIVGVANKGFAKSLLKMEGIKQTEE